MSTLINNPWPERDHYLQSLYISPCLQRMLPNEDFSREPFPVPAAVEEFIKEHAFPRLAPTFQSFLRSAATRFFNLRSARSAIERALRTEYAAIAEWLRGEQTVRFAFDYFGGDDDPIAGYGILRDEPTKRRDTKTVPLVLQRMPSDTYVLWTAYPLLAPRERCWLDVYDFTAHRPATNLSPWVYYFFNCYLSVTSIYLGADAVLQGATDLWTYELRESFEQVRQSVAAMRPDDLNPADQSHLAYELSIRCLDETLPHFYVSRPAAFVEALQHSFDCLANLYDRPPD